MVVILPVFGEPDSRKSLLIEGSMVTAAQVTVTAENQLRGELPEIVDAAYFMNIAGQFP